MEYRSRPETKMARALNKAVYHIGDKGIRNMGLKELKQVGLPIISEARARMRQLEANGLTDSPAYRYMKDLGIKISTAGNDINAIKNNVREAYEFLHKKTSTVEGAQAHTTWLNEHLGTETTQEQREKIFDLVHRFEKEHPQHFINYGYDEAIARIAKMTRATDFDVDEAYIRLSEHLKETGELSDIKPGERKRITPWYKKGSMSDY